MVERGPEADETSTVCGTEAPGEAKAEDGTPRIAEAVDATVTLAAEESAAGGAGPTACDGTVAEDNGVED